ncbi:MAG TPA: hypothetical protein VEY07_00995 [Thermoplasmata archaeon]|nr:hypothetical protein [Thermoplasmata archaeon]
MVLNDVEVPLHPAPPCSPYSSCPNNSTGGPPPTLELLPPPGVVRSVLLVAPIALAVVGALVVTLYRWRAARTARAPERPGPRREGPVGSDPGALP